MRTVVRNALRASLVAVAALGLAAASASAAGSPIVGHLYVNDNTTAPNTIAAFDRHADGTLTPVAGSPFDAGGSGTGTPLASQGSLQESANGHYLLAVDAGSNQLSVLRIEPGGTLSQVRGGLIGSGGLDPVSIAVHGRLVYVANAADGGANYTGFRLGHRGRLHAIPGSTYSLPDGSSPGDVLFNGDGSVLAGTRVGTSEIDSFRVRPDGRLTAAPGSPFAAQGPGPFGSEFRPTNSRQLFVSNAHGGGGAGTVSAFTVAASAALNPVGDSPFADSQTAPCWVEISHDGSHLFAVNTGSGSISSYSISNGGSLTLLGSTALHEAMGPTPEDARLSPDGASLWVVDSGLDQISGLAVDGGSLNEFASPPTALPAGAAPAGIVVR